jgi:hypothetical protein
MTHYMGEYLDEAFGLAPEPTAQVLGFPRSLEADRRIELKTQDKLYPSFAPTRDDDPLYGLAWHAPDRPAAFWPWLMLQRREVGPVGDLARGAINDDAWLLGASKTRGALRRLLSLRGAQREAFDAPDEAVEQWRDYKRYYNK